MMMNERDERNVILSFKRDIEKPDTSKEQLSQEINTFLRRKYISEENAMALEAMLTIIHSMIPDNENFRYSN